MLALTDPTPLPYFPPSQREAYTAYEAALNAIPTRDSLLAYHQLIAAEPHIAGTPGDIRNIDRIAKAFADMGLEVEKHEFFAYLCRPVAAELEIVSPAPEKLITAEQPLPEDKYTQDPARTFGWNAYSGSGDVTAPVVYANYGTKADFAKLAELGIDLKGKIVIARYGGNFRGYKAKFAQDAGAVGLIIFVDPADTGYAKGIPYPEGGYSNPTCIERGSIITTDYPGDPLTPGIEATKDAKRLDPATVDLPKIPVQPIGYAAAGEILKQMSGPAVPAGWQGGCPCAYRVSGGEGLRVRLHVEQKREIIPTCNVIATLRGSTEPDTAIVLGCHHDAWVCGAADPTCGTITLIESARSFAQLAKEGKRPARTILFCAWGAEEFGIIGSTEWVEGHTEMLTKHAAMYLNLDMASMGTDFGSGATPSLRRIIAECTHAVPQARDSSGKTVFDSWLGRGEDPLMPGQPKFGDLGGGSDHIAFLCHAGVPSASFGSSGSKGNSYHSTYDTLPWYWKVVGDDYQPALMITRMNNALAGRVASAPLLPLDPARYGPDTRRALIDLTKRAAELKLIAAPAAPREIAPQLARLEGASVEFAARAAETESRLLKAVAENRLSPDQLATINGLLMECDRAWLSDEGIPGRPWFKSLFAASDEDSGYAPWVLPGLRWAIEHKDLAALEQQQARYLAVFDHLTALNNKLETALQGGAR
jgi:N-acetylated-alpha-linked acidic dipeptidase